MDHPAGWVSFTLNATSFAPMVGFSVHLLVVGLPLAGALVIQVGTSL